MNSTRTTATAALVLADVAALVLLRSSAARFVREVPAPSAWLAQVGPDQALAVLAGAALWAVAGWLGIGLIAAAASRLPGAVGCAAACACRVVLPRVVLRVVAGSAGLGVFLVPVVAGAQPPGGRGPASPSISTVAATAIPAPTWPVTPKHAPEPAATGSVPAPHWPQAPISSPASTPTSTPTHPRPAATPRRAAPTPTSVPSTTAAPTTAPPTTAPPTTAPPTTAPPTQPPAARARQTSPHRPASTAAVRVDPDDSLWLLAARRLGPGASDGQIAHYWPRWYAANRDVIGEDPGLIIPGQVLRAPAPSAQETP